MSQLTHQEVLKLNRMGQRFGSITRKDMKAMTKGRLASGLVGRNKYSYGQLEAVGFVFPRFGVFYEMGVFGGLTRDEAREQGKLNPKPWFNPALDRHIPKFIEDLQATFRGFIINAIQLRKKLQIKHTEDG